MTDKVVWNAKVAKQLDRIPDYIRNKFFSWVLVIERMGIKEVRKLSGFHDEPLKGRRAGQRSVRLNKSYRAIYTENSASRITLIEVLEINNHDY